MICDRCRKDSVVVTGSIFNTEVICFYCREEEEKHPGFPRAKQLENEAVLRGDYNYPGIGLPEELRPK